LWAKNEAAREKFGYPIDHGTLPLSENTKRSLQALVAWFDTSLDWNDPSNSDSFWSEDEWQRFRLAARKSLESLRQELPSQWYEIIDETNV